MVAAGLAACWAWREAWSNLELPVLALQEQARERVFPGQEMPVQPRGSAAALRLGREPEAEWAWGQAAPFVALRGVFQGRKRAAQSRH